VKTASLQGNVTAGDDSVVYTWTTTADFIFNNPNQLTQTVNKPGTYTLQAQNLRNGCTALDSAMVSEDANYPTAVDLELINPTCFGFTNGQIQIKNVTGGTGPYLLSLNGSPLESVQRFNNLGAGKYDLIVEDVAGCDFKTEVILKEETELRVTLGADTTIRLGDVLTLEPFVNIPTQNIAKIEWDGKDKYGDCRDNCWLQSVSPKDSASYKVTVTSKNGCQASDVLLVKVLSSRSVYVPTGFSPNGDGYNDIFVIYGGREVVQIKSLKIMDRWGNQVFQAAGFRPNDPMRGWDGNIDGAKDPTPAVFAWIAEIEFLDGTSEFFWGDLTLVR
jgi:gliding motility-associated-like protein